MKNVVIKPLGKVLEQAGLISDYQIRSALEIQARDNQVKFGKILVSQGIVKQKTVDFFADQLPQLVQQPKTQPLGYYLQQASLIDAAQIEALLEEQKQRKLLLGELIIEKGWLTEKTLNFFLQFLDSIKQQAKLLSPSQQEIIESLHLETKAASPYYLLKEVFNWTGGHPLLTREICQIIAHSRHFIPEGLETRFVEKLVRDNVINNWEIQELGGYLKTIEYYLLNNTICLPQTLLKLYLQILQQAEVRSNQSQEQQELINLGLVVEQDHKLIVSNRLYQAIFNTDWVKKQLSDLEKKLLNTSDKTKKTRSKNQQISMENRIKNEPLVQIAAFAIALGLLVISPLVIFFNNSQHKLAIENDSLNSQSSSISTSCTASIPNELSSQETLLIRLQEQKQILENEFPENCQQNLDKLIVLNAINLGKENRVIEGINHLCQIEATSESFNQAKFWLTRWSDSPDWGAQTKYYLNSIDNCPGAKFN